MRLADVKIGDKYWLTDNSTRMFLRIDLKLSEMSLTTRFPKVVCALDLTTYKIICHNPDFEVEVEHDNVTI